MKISTPEERALELFAKGKTKFEVEDILFDEFPELTEWQLIIESERAWEIHKEKGIPVENKTDL